MPPPRLLLPVISPLPPLKRPNTRAFKRALLDVRHSAPEYLMQRLGLVGPLEAAAAAAATAGSMLPASDHQRDHRRTGGGNGGGGAAAAAGHATASFRPVASTSPDGLVAGGELSATSVSALTSASDPVAASTAASKAAAAVAGAYFTTYGAGFTRYKRWSMYDIDPAAENPDYWQAKAAALLMRRTSRAVRGVPGAGVATMSASAAAAAAAIAAADAAKDIELCRAVPVAAAAAVTAEGMGQPNNGKQLLPSASLQRRQQTPSQSTQSDGMAVGWHLPSLQTGATGSGAAVATVAAARIPVENPSATTTAPAAVAAAAAAVAASVTSPVGAAVRSPASPWRRTVDEPASPTRQKSCVGPHGRGLGACALGRGSAAAAMLSPRAAPSATAGATGSGACNSPIQYVIRPQHGTNPRLAAEALRRRPVPSAAADGDPVMQRLLSKSRSPQRSPSRSPQRSPQLSPQLSPQRSLQPTPQRSPTRSPQSGSPQVRSPQVPSPQTQRLQVRQPMQRHSPALPSVSGS
ncbi:hypothetical protein Vretifemale_12814 [Volvox reticuliferus]|nr:hypothetical protein Vretifemale_12814 [Volvox reticuliferus]